MIKRAVVICMVAIFFAASARPQSSMQAPARAAAVPKSPQITSPAPDRVPDKARAEKAYQDGQRAEQSRDWRAAYAAYSDAAFYAPDNKQFAALKEHARFQYVQELSDLAERQLLAGNQTGARVLLMQALEIDPTYTVASERLTELDSETGDHAEAQIQPRLAGLPRLDYKPGTHDFDYRGVTRGAYEELGRQFGVKMAFDADLSDRAIRFRVPQLDFETALRVLSQQSQTFTSVVDEHTLFVTNNTAQKIRDYAPEIEKSLVLPASVTSDEMNELVRAIREITGITRTQLDTAAHSLTVRSTEQNVALAQALVDQLELPHGEVMLEIEILEVDRNAATQLGITPPTSSTVSMLSLSEVQLLEAAENAGTLFQELQTLFGSGGALAGLGGATSAVLPPILAFGGGKTIFLATMPSVAANLSQTLNTVRSAQRVLLRAQDGKPATFFVGDRYPVSLGLLSSDLNSATAGLNPATLSALSGLLPRSDYPVGTAPIGVAVGDVNGDGIPDLIVANHSDGTTNGTISILLGTATGTFDTQTLITVPGASLPSTPSSIVVGNFGVDTNLDIAVTDSANNDVVVFRGAGSGTFNSPVTYPTGNKPVALITGSFLTNSYLDLAVVNQTDSTVSILLGQQDGSFAAQTTFNVGSSPSAITSADFNGDGFIDLAIADQTANTVSILLGNGDGTFKTHVDYATGNGPAGIAAADFNLDGKADLAVTNQTDGTVSILLGNGDGTFGAQTAFAAGSGPVGIVAATFTGGSYVDLAVADQTGDNVSVLIGGGNGTFSSPVSLPTGNGPVFVTDANLANAGALDVITANESSNTVTVTTNTLSNATSAAALAAAQSAYPGAEYIDLGLKIKATPRLHDDDQVTLQLEFDISALAGTSLNGIPVLSNETIEQTIRLRENETSVISGLIQSNDMRSISGYPWVATAPVVGDLTGLHSDSLQKTETIIVITPRALRLPPHGAAAIYAGPGEPSSPGGPSAPPPGPERPPAPGPDRPAARPGPGGEAGQPAPGVTPGTVPGQPQAPATAPGQPVPVVPQIQKPSM